MADLRRWWTGWWSGAYQVPKPWMWYLVANWMLVAVTAGMRWLS